MCFYFADVCPQIERAISSSEGSDFVADCVYKGRPRRGRKLKVPNQTRVDRKKLLNTNKTHINSKGNVYDEKLFDEQFNCMCTNKCTSIIPIEDRRRLFTQFWTIGTFPGRIAYLMNSVTKKRKKPTIEGNTTNDELIAGEATVEEGGTEEDFFNSLIEEEPETIIGGKKRNRDRSYSIFGQKACRKAVLGTLQISSSRVNTALYQYENCETLTDNRGKSSGGWNALPPAKREEVRAHIDSFPKYISHYTRAKSDGMYLGSDLNLAKMYRLYKDEAENPASESFYIKFFKDNFNLRFKTPKKDTCVKCDRWIIKKNAGEDLDIYEEWHDAHLKKAESLKAQMLADCESAKHDEELETLVFDMQKTLILPKLTASIAYYKRQLNLFNLDIYSASIGKGKFNLWTEFEASKGTQEIGSCLKLHIGSIRKPIKKLILWSDSCGGQNRSIKMVLMMMHILHNHETLESISMRFLLSGHSFLHCDKEFGEIENALKRHDHLYTLEQYKEVMEKCRSKNKFEVNTMSPENFFSIEQLQSLITNRKVDVNGNKVSWLGTHEILLEKDQPNIIKMRAETSGPFQTVNLKKNNCDMDFKNVILSELWPSGRPLSKEKIKDLREMLDLIPLEHRDFYDSLDYAQETDFVDDIDGFGEFVDFEVEYTDLTVPIAG